MQLLYRTVVTMVAAVTATYVLSTRTGTTPSPSEGLADVPGQVYPTMAGPTAVDLLEPWRTPVTRSNACWRWRTTGGAIEIIMPTAPGHATVVQGGDRREGIYLSLIHI